jgi:hypothetical protein
LAIELLAALDPTAAWIHKWNISQRCKAQFVEFMFASKALEKQVHIFVHIANKIRGAPVEISVFTVFLHQVCVLGNLFRLSRANQLLTSIRVVPGERPSDRDATQIPDFFDSQFFVSICFSILHDCQLEEICDGIDLRKCITRAMYSVYEDDTESSISKAVDVYLLIRRNSSKLSSH